VSPRLREKPNFFLTRYPRRLLTPPSHEIRNLGGIDYDFKIS